ncbi:hypothetical protein AB0467_34345 [Streptomyces sp. NPDC052095]|uniref:hypothetical protein n=1 Tax=unclassified Streptomyces TaxID=2593676 RepID=UPI00344ECE70
MKAPNTLPGPSRDGHYVYVILFNSGTIKVGRTMNPGVRLKNYATHGRPHGISVVSQWLSQPHQLARQNEEELIAFCKARFTSLNDGEFFADADATEVVAHAEKLTTGGNRPDRLRMVRFGRVAGRGGNAPVENPVVVVSLPSDLLTEIDAARGQLSRNQWLQQAARQLLAHQPAS